LAQKAMLADSMFSRMKGLMFSKGLGEMDALLISPCNSIHTFFMRFNLDLVFIGKGKVVKVIRNLPPWRMTRPYFRASQVLELEAGTLDARVKEGDSVEVVCIN
jgi:hypothetical protein